MAGRCLSEAVGGTSSARQSFLVPFCDDKKVHISIDSAPNLNFTIKLPFRKATTARLACF